MVQHFLMSAAARTLSLIDLCDLSEDAAHMMLCSMRWPDSDGALICLSPQSSAVVYTYLVSPAVQQQPDFQLFALISNAARCLVVANSLKELV